MDHQVACGIGAATFDCSGLSEFWNILYAGR
jgi:hypothetical protein